MQLLRYFMCCLLLTMLLSWVVARVLLCGVQRWFCVIKCFSSRSVSRVFCKKETWTPAG